MWHIFYKPIVSLRQRANARSFAVCATKAEADAKLAECRRTMSKNCWIEFIRQRADLDG